jgi:hypothetical protein
VEVNREPIMGKFKSVCVFCGSKSGNKKIFSDAALDLGRELVSIVLLTLFLSAFFFFFEFGGYFMKRGIRRLKGRWI